MKNYIALQLILTPCSQDATDLMAAFLADVGYESFEADEVGMTAYIDSARYNEAVVSEIISDFPIDCAMECVAEFVEGKDWNEEWERNYFQPIVIDEQCVIHSTFHKEVPSAQFDIVIDPKMAFGTGHHATTCMMIRALLASDIVGKNVIDMGTGTGILSILAKMLGANSVTGIEIDPGAAENARDNVALNHVEVAILTGDSSSLSECEKADIFLANINRNIILADLERYVASMKEGGTLLLSGFYKKDIPIIEIAAGQFDLKIIERYEEEGDWCALRLIKE